LITKEQLDWALEVQLRTRSRLGQILLAEGIIDRIDLYRVLAKRWGLEFVDVAHTDLDRELLTYLDPADLAAWGWIPIARLSDGRIAVATSEPPTIDLKAEIEQTLGNPVELAATTDWDILQGLHRAFQDDVLDRATVGLWLTDQKRSARVVLYPWQRVVLWTAMVLYAVVLFFNPVTTLIWTSATISVVFLVSVMFKFRWSGCNGRDMRRSPPKTSPPSRTTTFPATPFSCPPTKRRTWWRGSSRTSTDSTTPRRSWT
jgi:hypothetical protein